VNHAVTVTRATGTIVSATVSLGYDVPRARVKELLLQAAGEVPLEEPFVQVLELGDFSVTYRVAGLLSEVKQVISARSTLRCQILDALHTGGIEIMSPNFMNQRVLDPSKKVVPRASHASSPEAVQESSPEALAFDKADQAESVEKMQERHVQLGKDIDAGKELLKTAENPDEKQELERRIELLKKRREALAERAKSKEADLGK
jgi:small-conductance mechanosensitive channel